MPNDLTTKFKLYVTTLKNANTTKLDVNTLIVKDLPNAIAGKPAEVDDRNTLYYTHISG